MVPYSVNYDAMDNYSEVKVPVAEVVEGLNKVVQSYKQVTYDYHKRNDVV